MVIKNNSEFVLDTLELVYPFDPRLNKEYNSIQPAQKITFSQVFDGSTIYDVIPSLSISYK